MNSSRPFSSVTLFLITFLALSAPACSRHDFGGNSLRASLFDKTTVNHESQANRLIEQALKKDRQGDSQAVVNLLDEAIKLNPNSDRAYYNRGTIFLNLNKYQQAVDDFNKALKLNPKRFEAYLNRGDTWSNLGEISKAIADYKSAIQLKPNDSHPYINLGIALQSIKDYSGALAAYQQALKIAPQKSDIYYSRGITFTDMQRLSEALSDYDPLASLLTFWRPILIGLW
jgi:tetratricopeptide (TPR) repeat protein